jgi:hypothetical protein
MNKLLVLVFLFVTSNVWAEWTLIAESETASFYVDPSTIKVINKKVKFWQMTNFKNPSNNQSNKIFVEDNCEEKTSKFIYLARYSGLNGGGNMISSSAGEENATPVIPDSVGESVHNFVCNFKKQR